MFEGNAGKYNSEDGRIRRIKSLGDSEVKAQEEQRQGERAQQSSRYRSSQRRRKTKIESRWISSKLPDSMRVVRSE